MINGSGSAVQEALRAVVQFAFSLSPPPFMLSVASANSKHAPPAPFRHSGLDPESSTARPPALDSCPVSSTG